MSADEIRRARAELDAAYNSLEDAQISLKSAQRGYEYARRDFDSQLRLELRDKLDLRRSMQNAFQKTAAAKVDEARAAPTMVSLGSTPFSAGESMGVNPLSWNAPITLAKQAAGAAMLLAFTEQFFKGTLGAHALDTGCNFNGSRLHSQWCNRRPYSYQQSCGLLCSCGQSAHEQGFQPPSDRQPSWGQPLYW